MDLPGPRAGVPQNSKSMLLGNGAPQGSYHGGAYRPRQPSIITCQYPAGLAARGGLLGAARNEWCRRRALAEQASVTSASSVSARATYIDEVLSSSDEPSTSGREFDQAAQLASSGGEPMLQLMAAWDSLSSRLPPSTNADADVLVKAVKTVLTHAPPDCATNALSLASRLAELAGEGLPIDADSIAAAILAEGFPYGLPFQADYVRQRMGQNVARLLADHAKIARLPARIDLYDDTAAAALRELCLNFYDVRATAAEVVARLLSLQREYTTASGAECQVLALEALQIYAPMGHAMGLGGVSAQLEDLCFSVLFPTSYRRTTQWLENSAATHEGALQAAEQTLQEAVAAIPEFYELAAGVEVQGRSKSPFSTLKKLLRLGDVARGGRALSEVYDLLGLRAVVIPREDLPPFEAEFKAREACYLVEKAAHSVWRAVEGRSKDYIASPKPNGYQSLHSTVEIDELCEGCCNVDGELFDGPQVRTLELQIRTQVMHYAAESGEAAHAAYKGGLDATQARQLRDWTHSLLERGALAPTPASLPSASADEALFHSMDINGDGRVSLDELHYAVAELGEGAAESAAAALLAAADANSDGTISLEEFLAFQKKVGLLHAASAMDTATAGVLKSQRAEDVSFSLGGSESDSGNEGWILRPASREISSGSSMSEVSNATTSRGPSALHTWRSRTSTRAPQKAVCSAFIERDGSSGGGGSNSSASSMDDLVVRPRRAPGTAGATAPSKSNGAAAVALEQQHNHETNGGSAGHSNGSSHSGNNISSMSDVNRGCLEGESAAPQPTVSSSPPSPNPVVADVSRASPSSPSLPTTPSISSDGTDSDTEGSFLAKPDREAGWRMQQTVRGFVRMFQQSGIAQIDATWQLAMLPSAAERVVVFDAAGQPLTVPRDDRHCVLLPRHGPCIVGAVRDRDCDLVMDISTVSGRHARLEVIRLRGIGRSKCVLMDLGSTNGTWVNRARITPFVEVPLYPGDIVCLAEPGIAFEVRVADEKETASEVPGPAVAAALRVAAALEAEAASRGVFAPPNAAEGAEAGGRARQLQAQGEYQAAYMLLLGGAMSHPTDPALWAQLGGIERQRARRREQGSSAGTVRAFFRAAVERFEACDDLAVRRSGLARVFSSWAQLEYDLRNDGPARILFQKAVRTAKAHPGGPRAAGAAKLLFTWANRERKLDDAPLAARLCREALELDPSNAYALTLLGNIHADAGDVDAARACFQKALESDRTFASALQSWGRAEAAVGNMRVARKIFSRALRADPANRFVLQAWAVAEARAGHTTEARTLLDRCTRVDPACRAAWHAWGKLEEEAGNVDRARELYQTVLRLKPTSVETLSALGRLERTAGDLVAAEVYLNSAIMEDARHAPSLQELASVRRSQGLEGEAYRLEKKARRVNQDKRAVLTQVAKSATPLGELPLPK